MEIDSRGTDQRKRFRMNVFDKLELVPDELESPSEFISFP